MRIGIFKFHANPPTSFNFYLQIRYKAYCLVNLIWLKYNQQLPWNWVCVITVFSYLIVWPTDLNTYFEHVPLRKLIGIQNLVYDDLENGL